MYVSIKEKITYDSDSRGSGWVVLIVGLYMFSPFGLACGGMVVSYGCAWSAVGLLLSARGVAKAGGRDRGI